MAQVDNFTLSCMDFRFRDKIAHWIDNNTEGSDLIAIAGASYAVLHKDWQDTTLTQIELGLKLHDIKVVHIIDHIDCGAYGGSAKFDGDKTAEIAMHREELAKAAKVIEAKFDGLTVETHIIDFVGML